LKYIIYKIKSQAVEKSIYTKTHQKLVRQLVKARKEAGLKQQEVAKLLGRTQSYVSKIESGQRRIDIVQLKEFARIYKKKLDYFIK
jgi:transcriptional regulator with XRE-family HTH domain